MKITKTDDLVKAVTPDKMQSRPTTTQADFGDVLKETMQTAGGAQNAVQASIGVEPVLPLQLQRLSAIDKQTIVEGIENVDYEIMSDSLVGGKVKVMNGETVTVTVRFIKAQEGIHIFHFGRRKGNLLRYFL